MKACLFPCAIAAAVALVSVPTVHAAFIEFDINKVSVQAVNVGNLPMTDATYAGTLQISANSNTFINGVLYNGSTLSPITLVGLTGTFTVGNTFSADNGGGIAGSLSLTFKNPDNTINTYTYIIPVDTVDSPGDRAVAGSVSPTRYLASWITNTSVLATPEVSTLNFPNPLGFGYFEIHDFEPELNSNSTLNLDTDTNIDIAVDVPDVVPEPATLLIVGSVVPALLFKRR